MGNIAFIKDPAIRTPSLAGIPLLAMPPGTVESISPDNLTNPPKGRALME